MKRYKRSEWQRRQIKQYNLIVTINGSKIRTYTYTQPRNFNIANTCTTACGWSQSWVSSIHLHPHNPAPQNLFWWYPTISLLVIQVGLFPSFLVKILYAVFFFVFSTSGQCSPRPSVFLLLESVYKTFARAPWTEDFRVARPAPVQEGTNRKRKVYIHSCLKWDWNPRPQWWSGRRQGTPQTAGLIGAMLRNILHCSFYTSSVQVSSPAPSFQTQFM
jgi:hypothetical protein